MSKFGQDKYSTMKRKGPNGLGKHQPKTISQVISNPCKKRWKVFKLSECGRVISSGPEFQDRITAALQGYYEHKIEVQEHKETLWGMIQIVTAPKSEKVYIVHPPRSGYVFHTLTRASRFGIMSVFQQVFCTVFNCPKVEELQLEGNDVEMLKDLALQKLSQGAFSCYRLCASAFDYNPLEDQEQVAKRRRMIIDKVQNEEKLKEEQELLKREEKNQVILQSEKRKPGCSFTCNSNGGNENEAKFSNICVRSRNNQFSCYIQLQGNHVLKGIESLYENDLVVEDREIPGIFDANEVMRQTIDGESEESNTKLLWSKTN